MHWRELLIRSAAAVLLVTVSTSAAAGIWGLPKFKIEQSDDRFSTDGLTTITGIWNRISKRSVAGGVHIDASGMFVEPAVIKRKADGAIVKLGFFIHNETQRDSAVGEPNSIGVPERISFLTGEGPPIALSIASGDRKWGEVSSYGRFMGVTTTVSETGFAEMSIDQYRRIMNAPALAAKVDGSTRSVTYETKHISKAFLFNLRQFHDQHLTS